MLAASSSSEDHHALVKREKRMEGKKKMARFAEFDLLGLVDGIVLLGMLCIVCTYQEPRFVSLLYVDGYLAVIKKEARPIRTTHLSSGFLMTS